MVEIKPRISGSDSLLARTFDDAPSAPAFEPIYAKVPQSLIDLMPSANDHIARLKSVALDFVTMEEAALGPVVNRIVAHLSEQDVHPASLTLH